MPLAPTPPRQRDPSLDILRGLALFGVLLENMQHFVSPPYRDQAFGPEGGGLDRLVFWGLHLFCENKVYMLFALLFGYGIGLQARRAAGDFLGLHLWRMGTLALIGLAHSLVWEGDILLTYALLAMLLLPLRRASDGWLHGVAAVFLLLPLAAQLLAFLVAKLEPGARPALEAWLDAHRYAAHQSSFAFAMLAAGLAAGRANRLADAPAFLEAARPRLGPALALAALGHAVVLGVMMASVATPWRPLSPPGLLLAAGIALGAPALVFVYVVLALRWLERPAWRRRLGPLADVGRSTLSNYVLQSLIGVGILSRTGLGPLGPITPPLGVVLTVLIFAFQVAASRWWLARFQFGPVEWLWRSVTYGALQPLRVARSAQTGRAA